MKRLSIYLIVLAAIAACWFLLKPVAPIAAESNNQPAVVAFADTTVAAAGEDSKKAAKPEEEKIDFENWRSITFMTGKSKMPEAKQFLPPPPTVGDERFVYDSLQYEWGKSLRGTARGELAVKDANTEPAYFMERFGKVIGIKLTPEKYPKTFRLIAGTLNDVRGSIQTAKDSFARQRPYQYFNEPTPIPEYEDPTDFTSYPSGHSVRGWSVAMLFSILCPEYSTAIMNTGYEIGQSRVIVGYHYQSDVDASRLAASAGFARLCAEPSYMKAVEEARNEIYSSKKK